jgi:hypothetical protein
VLRWPCHPLLALCHSRHANLAMPCKTVNAHDTSYSDQPKYCGALAGLQKHGKRSLEESQWHPVRVRTQYPAPLYGDKINLLLTAASPQCSNPVERARLPVPDRFSLLQLLPTCWKHPCLGGPLLIWCKQFPIFVNSARFRCHSVTARRSRQRSSSRFVTLPPGGSIYHKLGLDVLPQPGICAVSVLGVMLAQRGFGEVFDFVTIFFGGLTPTPNPSPPLRALAIPAVLGLSSRFS